MLRGRCGCRTVSFEVADEFVVSYNCHCSNCRAETGAAFLPWGQIEREKLRFVRGESSLLIEGDPEGRHVTRCGKCFSVLYWTVSEQMLRVPYGTLIDSPALRPMGHMFVGSKAPWYEICDELPQHQEYPWRHA
jgi:hypothetical protein